MSKNSKVIIIISLIFLSLGLYLLIKDIYIVHNYSPVNAQIHEVFVPGKNTRSKIECVYEYNGKEYSSYSSRINRFKMKEGKIVTIYIDSNNPEWVNYPDFFADIILISFILCIDFLYIKFHN